MELIDQLLLEAPLWSREQVLRRPSPVPRLPGVYAWFFRQVPPGIPTGDCLVRDGYTLLYVGIAPKAPPQNGATASRQSLVHRIRYHYRGNAEGSTLRLTLGCLMSGSLGLTLRRVGSGNRLTFGPGEEVLSGWMGNNAFVAWVVTERPWEAERSLIERVSLPLNLEHNARHPFCSMLASLRRSAREQARTLPILGS